MKQNQACSIVVSDNTIHVKNIKLKSNVSSITIYDCENVRLFDNTVFTKNIDLNSFTFNSILFGRTNYAVEDDNLTQAV